MDSFKLSPSARAILTLLQSNGDLSSSEIIAQMDFSARTIRYALKALLSKSLVEKKSLIYDMRYTKYSLSPTYYKYSGSIPISKVQESQALKDQMDRRYTR